MNNYFESNIQFEYVSTAYKSTRWETTSKYVIMHQNAFRVKNFQCSVTFNLESRVQIDDGQLNAVLNEKKNKKLFYQTPTVISTITNINQQNIS